MIRFFAAVFGAVMNCLYALFKLQKTKNRIAFISRQSETPSLDFRMLIDTLQREYPQYEIAVLCKMIPAGIGGKIAYAAELLRQMNAMATSRVVVLDGYCILASMLNHGKDLKIIQIWHALGAFKKFGKSVVGKEGGKSAAVAEGFKMHRNYDLIAASGESCALPFAEAFGQPVEKIVPIGIPRMDYLTDETEAENRREAVFAHYPELNNGKKTILYAPTFRDTDADRAALKAATDALVRAVDYSRFNLVVKHHVVDTNKEQVYTNSAENLRDGEAFTAMDFMAVSDAVITDYSSVIYEALLQELSLYLYCFDSEKYIDERGFYIDFFKDIPAVFGATAEEICTAVSENRCAEAAQVKQFKERYVNKQFDSITVVWCTVIDELARGVYDGRYNYRAMTD